MATGQQQQVITDQEAPVDLKRETPREHSNQSCYKEKGTICLSQPPG